MTDAIKVLRPARALHELQAQARYCFDEAVFAQAAGRDRADASLRRSLLRLVRDEKLAQLTKNPTTWAIVPPEYRWLGAPPAEWWLDACLTTVANGYYVGLLSAARHWGSAHYAAQEEHVMLDHARAPLEVGRLRVRFFVKRDLMRTPTETAVGEKATYRVSTREATLIDLVRHQHKVGGLDTVARVMHDLAPALSRPGLIAALNALNQTSAAQRLGALFELLAIDAMAETVADWLRLRRTQPIWLTVAYVDEGTMRCELPRWSIRCNADELRQLRELA